MEKIEGFSAVGIDEVEWSEFTSSWSIKFMVELEDRKYHKDFNPRAIPHNYCRAIAPSDFPLDCTKTTQAG